MTKHDKAKLEYKKMLMEKRKRARALHDEALPFCYTGKTDYADLDNLWEYYENKSLGIPYRLDVIYALGLCHGAKGEFEK